MIAKQDKGEVVNNFNTFWLLFFINCTTRPTFGSPFALSEILG